MTKKIALVLRGYHYNYNHKALSSFYRKYGAYTVDYERHFLDSFKKTIMNDKRFDIDYFMVTNESEKLNKLLKEIKPVSYKLKDLSVKVTKGVTIRGETILDACELVEDYSKNNNVVYDFILINLLFLLYFIPIPPPRSND